SLGNKSWQKFYGGSKADASDGENRLAKLNDNLFAIGGWSNSDDGDVGLNYGKEDYWFLAVDSGGNIISKKVLGGSDNDYMYSCRYIISRIFQVGQTYSDDYDILLSHGDGDGWVVELSNVDIIGEFNIDTLQIKVYPNPVNGGFNILLPDQFLQKKIFIEILSMNGIILQRDEVKTKNHQVLFAMKIAGTFLYQLKEDNGRVLVSGRLIVN
ncbi:MAG TPA: T9SS type A sorting domain-containing protein, partial [Chitinophagales bacterium]|nr:T9SS type A sorting domain-containing protein [Chitinophagales bacterium]